MAVEGQPEASTSVFARPGARPHPELGEGEARGAGVGLLPSETDKGSLQMLLSAER